MNRLGTVVFLLGVTFLCFGQGTGISALVHGGQIEGVRETLMADPKLSGFSLGQKPPGATPEIFEPGAISSYGILSLAN